MNWREWGRQLLRRGERDRELAEEMRLHVEMKEESLRKQGLTPEQARRAARLAFGEPAQMVEESRWQWLPRRLEESWQDVRTAARSFRRSPGFLAAALATMALGIGANTAIFSLVEAVLLRTLPVTDPQGLVEVRPKLRSPDYWTSGAKEDWGLSYPLYRDIAAGQKSFSCLYAKSMSRRTLAESGGRAWPTRPHAHLVSGCYFETLGVRAMLGRTFTSEENGTGRAARVAVLSYQAWRRHFGADPKALGQTLVVDRVPLEVVGVMGPEFTGDSPAYPADLWMPLELQPALDRRSYLEERGMVWFEVMGRLGPGVSRTQAQAEMTGLLRSRVRTDVDEWNKQGSNTDFKPEMFRVELLSGAGGFSELRERYEEAFGALMGIVGLLLVLACLNVAGLLLARGAARQREIGVRMALGAGRGRVLRHLLTESLSLAILGAGAGVALAHLFTSRLVRMLTVVGNPMEVPYALNGSVLLFTLGVTCLAALAAGLLPAWHAASPGASAHLSAGRAAAHGRTRAWWSRALVAGQVALGVVLASGAVLMIGTLRRLHGEQLGLRAEGVLVTFAEFAPGTNMEGRKGEFAKQAPRMEALREKLEALPGVRSAALASMSPMSGWMMATTFHTPRHSTGRGMAMMNWVSPGYFETLETPLAAGRLLGAEDLGAGRRAVVIDEALARTLFPGESPVGREMSSGSRFDPTNARLVVGVVKENRWSGPKQNDPKFRGLVWELMVTAREPFRVALVRAQGDAARLAPAVRQALGEAMPEMVVTETAKLDQLRDDRIQQERLMAALCSLFGVVALGVIFSGLYGLLAYSVERRVPEIGVRMALGARRGDVVRMVSREALALVGAGLVVGVPLAVIFSRVLKALVWQGRTGDPMFYAVTSAMVLVTGLAATAWPAWRASRVEPGVALREE